MSGEVETEWVPVKCGGEEGLFIEVARAGGREQVGLLETVPIEKVMALVTEVARTIGQALEQVSPTKAGVEVGIEFGLREGQLVGLIARGSGKANLKVTLEWDRSGKAS